MLNGNISTRPMAIGNERRRSQYCHAGSCWTVTSIRIALWGLLNNIRDMNRSWLWCLISIECVLLFLNSALQNRVCYNAARRCWDVRKGCMIRRLLNIRSPVVGNLEEI
jgi:hypothetical protein